MDKISIDKLVVFGNHGVFEAENMLGQKFLVSVVVYTDTRKAGLTDDLACSVNYGDVSRDILKFFQNNTFKLIETVAEKLAQELLLRYDLAEKVDVKIEKPWAPVAIPVDSVSVEISRGWHRAYIATGSNMGDKKAYLDRAVALLDATDDCSVIRVSDYLVTEPYGGVEQDDFLNGALELKTLLTPYELLNLLHEIEADANRERIIHWGPRTLDLDILLYDDEVIDAPDLHIPHIEMHLRDFVLIPMAEIAPWKRHPITNMTMLQMLQALQA